MSVPFFAKIDEVLTSRFVGLAYSASLGTGKTYSQYQNISLFAFFLWTICTAIHAKDTCMNATERKTYRLVVYPTISAGFCFDSGQFVISPKDGFRKVA